MALDNTPTLLLRMRARETSALVEKLKESSVGSALVLHMCVHGKRGGGYNPVD